MNFPFGASLFPAQSIALGLISIYELDETGGSIFEDDGVAGVDMAHQGSWTSLSTGSLVEGEGGTSAYTDGSAYATIPANQSAHNLAELTISFYYQPITSVTKHILMACGDGSQVGDFSIELLTNGRLRGWHVDQGGLLRFFEGGSGITSTNLELDTAYWITLRLGGIQGARLSLDGVEVAAIPTSSNGWNNSRIKHFGRWVDGTAGPAVGIFDKLRIWDRQLSGAEIALLPAAQSITIGTPISIWEFDEQTAGGGVFEDDGSAGVDMTIQGTWGDLATEPLVSGELTSPLTSTSAFTDGDGYATLPADQVAHDLTELTLSFYYQRGSSAAKHILFACGDGSAAGDFSIEVLANGSLRGWHVGDDALLDFFESTTGIVGTNLAVGVAHRVNVTMGPAGVKVYLNGDELTAAAIPGNINAWNNGRVKYLGRWTDGVQAPAVGIFDKLRIWDRQLSGAEIALLPAAQSITIGVPPDEELICINRPGATVITDHKDLGTTSTQQNLNDGGDVSYDLSGSTVVVTWSDESDQTPTPQYAFRLIGNHNGSCASRGAVRGNIDPAWQWGPSYPDNSGGVAFHIGASSGGGSQTVLNHLWEACRAHRVWDAFRMGWTSPRPDFITIRGSWLSDMHDDAVENDQLRTLHVLDCLFDGVFSGVSTDNNGSVPGGTEVVCDGMLLRMRPMGAQGATASPGLNPGHGQFIKNGRDGDGIPHDVVNCGFALQQAANSGSDGTGDPPGNPFRRLFLDGTVRTWTNNTIYWLNDSTYPWQSLLTSLGLASETTILTGATAASAWNTARSNWLTAHPLVPRLGSPYDDGFTIPLL